MHIVRIPVGRHLTNSYLLTCGRVSLLVDPGDEAGTLLNAVAGTHLSGIVCTHGHFDHTGALAEVVEATGATAGAHPADASKLPVTPDLHLRDGQVLKVGRCSLRVHHLPGHTPGSVGLQVSGRRRLVGDAVFPGGPGHTESVSAFAELLETLRQRIFALPAGSLPLPGHGPSTTVGRERGPFNQFARNGWADGAFGDVQWSTRPERAPA
jgi:glyoxylase-like metal-dependent hydrolase (beta-lactamase superfamily II)